MKKEKCFMEEVGNILKFELRVNDDNQQKITQTICDITKILNGLSKNEIKIVLKATKIVIGNYLLLKSLD